MAAGHDPLTKWLSAVAATGSREAFGRLYDHFRPRIAAFLRNRGAPERIAEEIAQDVMTTVWMKAASFDASKAAASTWIFTIARNAHIDHVRKERRREVDPDDPFFTPDPEPAPDERERPEAGMARLAAAVAALPPEQAEIIRLCYLGGVSHRQAAARLGLALHVVKYRARTALERLRRSMGPQS